MKERQFAVVLSIHVVRPLVASDHATDLGLQSSGVLVLREHLLESRIVQAADGLPEDPAELRLLPDTL